MPSVMMAKPWIGSERFWDRVSTTFTAPLYRLEVSSRRHVATGFVAGSSCRRPGRASPVATEREAEVRQEGGTCAAAIGRRRRRQH